MNIVVGYVDTPLGRSALDTGIHEARLRGARLHVLHFARVGIRNENPQVLARYRERMAEIAGQLDEEGVEGRSELVMASREAESALLHELRELPADLLIIGARSRSPVGKLVLGSKVQHLLLRADCPILVVRQPSA